MMEQERGCSLEEWATSGETSRGVREEDEDGEREEERDEDEDKVRTRPSKFLMSELRLVRGRRPRLLAILLNASTM